MSNSEHAATNPLDSELCAGIPISFITSVQPNGHLLVVSRQNLEIIQVSQNLLRLLRISEAELLGKPLSEFVMAQTVAEIKSSAELTPNGNYIPSQLFFSTHARTLNCLAVLHLQEQYLLLELEEIKAQEPLASFVNIYQQIKQILNSLKKSGGTASMLQLAAIEIKNLSGFDRVMMYRFDKDWNGTVVAEAVIPELEPFLDLRFPASDIPKQARELYLKTPYRIIPDVQYEPVPLIPPFNPITGSPSDLSDCSLRGVPEVHLEYLRNMGVGSSMSTSIIKDNQLWGLISCHHRTAKYLSYESRSAFELVANVISSQLSAREYERTMNEKTELNKMHVRLLELMSVKNDFIEGLTSGTPSILEFLQLSGAVLANENTIKTIGTVPSPEQVQELVSWLTITSDQQLFYTDSLPKQFLPAQQYGEIASGLIFLSLSANNDSWLIGFKPEVIQQVKWGGDPNKHLSISVENGEMKLHPRNSFQQWKEIVRHTSVSWEDFEIEAAQTLRNSILEVILKMQILKRMVAEEEVYKLSIVASKTDNAVVILNKNGTVDWINQAFTNYTGIDLKAAVGKNMQELTKTSRSMEEVGEIISKSAYNSSSFSKDISFEKDNKRYYINFNFTPISNPQEEFDKCVAIGSDITQIREYAEQLETINKELDKFAYIIAHDLKAPLRSIESLTDAIHDNMLSGDNSDTPELLKYLNRSVKRMSHLITEVLSYSRIGRINIEQEQVDVNEVLADVIEWLNPPPNVQIEVETSLPVIETVKVDLQQIFSNLISNAIKHSQKEDCTIRIKFTDKPDAYQFQVRDNGQGIPAEYHDSIFEMFQRAPNSASKTDDFSTGIGLATVKKLVDEKGGRLWLESVPGKGAAFCFTLPKS